LIIPAIKLAELIFVWLSDADASATDTEVLDTELSASQAEAANFPASAPATVATLCCG